MRSLLDVNVLLALFDTEHIFHERARAWLDEAIGAGWASCPITQAGFIRIVSSPRYPAGVTTTEAMRLLEAATADPHHKFWPDDLPLVDRTIDAARVLGPNQVTDVYLLALAVHHGGRLVTFDQRIATEAVAGATTDHLLVL